MAASPLAAGAEGDASARVLLPVARRDELQLDVVEDPSATRPNRQVAAFKVAISKGQKAAHLERIGEHEEAAERWLDASAWHRRAGDDRRARHAEARTRAGDVHRNAFRNAKAGLAVPLSDRVERARRGG